MKTYDFATMNGPQLVDTYNEMLQTWTDLGGDNTFGTVKRFSTPEVGRKRCEKLHAAIQVKIGAVPEATPVQTVAATPVPEPEQANTEESEEMAKRKAGRKPARTARSRSNGGPTIRTMTEEYNSLVPAAKKAGVKWAKHHTSMFGSLEAAKTQLTRLKRAIG